MNSNARTVHKTPVMVEISLTDGSLLLGKIFVLPQSRLTDVLNDDRSFLPIESMDGTFLALAKSVIKQVTLPSAEVTAYQGNDPYVILGIREGASREELKKAYHQMCKINHPDQIKGFGLGTEYQVLATQNMARINNAYAQILKKCTD